MAAVLTQKQGNRGARARPTTMKLCPSCGVRYEDEAKFCQHDGTLLRTVKNPEDEDPYLGEVLLGQFEVSSLLGSGGMGRVYKARQLGFDRPVAIKILHNELVENEEMVKRFDREAKIISRLDHPSIIHVYLFGALPDGNLYLAMEFVDGQGLGKIISEGAVPAGRAIAISAQILSALEEAHSKGVVHRDLKPDNIMLMSRNGDQDVVKVLDFGIAKFLGSRTMLTQQGLVFGSARYISPEAAAGEDVDERADLYAVGVILYHMLAGEPPFDDKSAVNLLMRHVNDPAPPLLEKASHVAGPVAAVVMRALEKDPNKRFEDAAAMRGALLEAAGRGGIPLPGGQDPATRWSSMPANMAVSASPPPVAPAPDPASDTNPMFATKPGNKPFRQPAIAEPSAASATSPGTPAAVAAAGGQAALAQPPAPVVPAEVAPESADVYPYDDDDDPVILPRSRMWILFVIIAILAVGAGALAALFLINGSSPGTGENTPSPVKTVPPPVDPGPEQPVAETESGTTDEQAPTKADGGLTAVAEPPTGDPAEERPNDASKTTVKAPREGRPDPSSKGMPPSASLRVVPRRAKVGSTVRMVAKIQPEQAVRSPRFVIKRRGGGGAQTLEARQAEKGVYHVVHAFTEAGSYQISFRARTSHGELQAFAEANIVSVRRNDDPQPGPTKVPTNQNPTNNNPTNNNPADPKPPENQPPLVQPWNPPSPVPPPPPWSTY